MIVGVERGIYRAERPKYRVYDKDGDQSVTRISIGKEGIQELILKVYRLK